MDEGGKEGAGMIERKYDVMAFILSLKVVKHVQLKKSVSCAE
jgi:hypothetical protein